MVVDVTRKLAYWLSSDYLLGRPEVLVGRLAIREATAESRLSE